MLHGVSVVEPAGQYDPASHGRTQALVVSEVAPPKTPAGHAVGAVLPALQ